MQVHCPHCQALVPAGDLELSTLLGKCRGCQAVFPFRPPGADAPPPKPRPAMPARFVLEEQGADFAVNWRWWKPAYFGLVAFACFWDGFLLFWYAIAFSGDSPLVMKVFPLVHVAVGAGITWFLVAAACNRTHVAVQGGKLTVVHSPIPWPGNRVVPPGGLEQIYVVERTAGRSNGRVTYSYDVLAVLAGGSDVKLVGGFETPEQAIWLEQRLEDGLAIRDQPRPGEFRPA